MVKQNTIAGEHAIRLAVFLHHPKSVLLRHRVRAVRVERGRLALRALLHLPIQFGSRRLVNAARLVQAEHVHRLQNAQHADGVHVPGVFRRVEADPDMALRGQVVNLVRTHQVHDTDDAGRIRQVAVMQGNRPRRDQMVNPLRR